MEYHLVYLTDQTKSSSAFRMFFKFVCPDFCETKTYFLIWKWVFKPKNFSINRGERTDQEEMALLPTQNNLPKLCWNTPQPEDTLSELRQLKYENPLFYLTLHTVLEVEAKPRQRGWLICTACSLTWVNVSMWGEYLFYPIQKLIIGFLCKEQGVWIKVGMIDYILIGFLEIDLTIP